MTNNTMQKPTVKRIPASNTAQTERIQNAIDLLASEGGGKLVLETGVHDCGGIRLASGIHLHLSEGAILRAVTEYDAFSGTVSRIETEDSTHAFLLAQHSSDVTISGPGIIDGRGGKWFIDYDEGAKVRVPAFHRPRLLVIEDCENVKITNLRIQDAPMWTVHLIGSLSINISDIEIENDFEQPNTDGIVVDGCEDVDIRRAKISAADDSVVIKTSPAGGNGTLKECKRVTVRNVEAQSRGCAFKIGTETHENIEDVVFEDCVAVDTNRGVGIFSRDGGTIKNVTYRRLELTCRETSIGYWGTGEAIALTVVDRDRNHKIAGEIKNVVIEDITGTMQGAANFVSIGKPRITDVRISRVHLEQAEGQLGHGRHCDMRPTQDDVEPPQGSTGRTNAWFVGPDGNVVGYHAYPDGMPGIFVQNVNAISFDNVNIERDAPRPLGWRSLDVRFETEGFAGSAQHHQLVERDLAALTRG